AVTADHARAVPKNRPWGRKIRSVSQDPPDPVGKSRSIPVPVRRFPVPQGPFPGRRRHFSVASPVWASRREDPGVRGRRRGGEAPFTVFRPLRSAGGTGKRGPGSRDDYRGELAAAGANSKADTDFGLMPP